MCIFQSTLPREERPRRHAPAHKIARNFNPRSHERSDVGCLLRLFYHLNFNPRSHERSDKPFIYKALRTIISIHAPTRGATAASVMREESSQFQSTLPREERLLELALILIACVFQSTLPREERLTDANVQLYAKSISIHAPTRGAT